MAGELTPCSWCRGSTGSSNSSSRSSTQYIAIDTYPRVRRRASWGLISVVAGVDLLTAGGVKAVAVVEVGVAVDVGDLSTEGV